MESLQIDRRKVSPPAAAAVDGASTTRHLRLAIGMQATVGTIGAIEYLKAQGIDSGLIVRVLSGGQVREEDQSALDELTSERAAAASTEAPARPRSGA